ncbi:MAG: phosphonate C-P lyase system protein PhnG [Desulfarculaceae bacterium]|jgi:alpha-D-ribose 1-methylphosphonate 5-triphosphate synthase subunit PhnG
MNEPQTSASDQVAARQAWMASLAKAASPELLELWAAWPQKPGYKLLRPPETGLIMVQGRVGGSGSRFNLGEMTMTRCVVVLDDGTTGYSYIAGRKPEHAQVAAILDALMQRPEQAAQIQQKILGPLERKRQLQAERASVESASTKVDFFTMVRGED